MYQEITKNKKVNQSRRNEEGPKNVQNYAKLGRAYTDEA